MMAGPFTIDASVFLNAFNPGEPSHADSRLFLDRLQKAAIPTINPTLLLPEVSAAIARGRQDAELAQAFAYSLSRLPHLVLVPLSIALARQASKIAAQYRLRGSDSVYAAVAVKFGCPLITLDDEQRKRLSKVLQTSTPLAALKTWSP
jgi:predicted nucleic acid-binding protein